MQDYSHIGMLLLCCYGCCEMDILFFLANWHKWLPPYPSPSAANR